MRVFPPCACIVESARCTVYQLVRVSLALEAQLEPPSTRLVVLPFHVQVAGSVPGTVTPAPPNHTYYRMLSHFSFRVQDRGVVAERMSAAGVPLLFEFANDQLQLYLQFVRDPTTGVLIECVSDGWSLACVL